MSFGAETRTYIPGNISHGKEAFTGIAFTYFNDTVVATVMMPGRLTSAGEPFSVHGEALVVDTHDAQGHFSALQAALSGEYPSVNALAGANVHENVLGEYGQPVTVVELLNGTSSVTRVGEDMREELVRGFEVYLTKGVQA